MTSLTITPALAVESGRRKSTSEATVRNCCFTLPSGEKSLVSAIAQREGFSTIDYR
jgi:hypothetical protein